MSVGLASGVKGCGWTSSREINLRLLPHGGSNEGSADTSQAGEGFPWWETGRGMLETGEEEAVESRLKGIGTDGRGRRLMDLKNGGCTDAGWENRDTR